MANKIHILAYYGGKTNMQPTILPILNNDKSTTFVSLFTGGAVLETNKKPHTIEIWNDKLHSITNFYEVFQTPTLQKKLIQKINSCCYSEVYHTTSKHAYNYYIKNPPKKTKDKISFAWAFWSQCCMTFSGNINGGYAFSSTRNQAMVFYKRKKGLCDFAKRIEDITIMCRDAVDVFKLFNKPDTLFYADPPYIGSDCGHYKGYTENDYINLLECFENCKGKFILSSYPSEILNKFIQRNSWNTIKINQSISAGHKMTRNVHTKVEVVITNFKTDDTISMFP